MTKMKARREEGRGEPLRGEQIDRGPPIFVRSTEPKEDSGGQEPSGMIRGRRGGE